MEAKHQHQDISSGSCKVGLLFLPWSHRISHLPWGLWGLERRSKLSCSPHHTWMTCQQQQVECEWCHRPQPKQNNRPKYTWLERRSWFWSSWIAGDQEVEQSMGKCSGPLSFKMKWQQHWMYYNQPGIKRGSLVICQLMSSVLIRTFLNSFQTLYNIQQSTKQQWLKSTYDKRDVGQCSCSYSE